MKGNRINNFIHCVSAICIITILTMTVSIGEHAAWDCPECGRTGNTGNYCGGCGHPSPWIAGGWVLENNEDTEATQETKVQTYKTIGNYVTFGTYPQTLEGTDQTPIEWLVLDYDAANNKVLLLSKYGLDAKSYNDKKKDVTWETCTLRKWLNTEFLSTAFSVDEQFRILMTDVDNGSSQGYSGWRSTSGGNDTQDKIFLLSYAEANHYFAVTKDNHSNLMSRVAPTAYARKQGAKTSFYGKTADGDLAGWWWLRSPGYYQYSAAGIRNMGSLDYEFLYKGCVRPALWVNLEMDIF